MRSHTAASHQSSSGNEKLPALVSGLQSPTSSRSRRRAAQKKIVARATAKCSSSRSLYYVDSNEFDSRSSRLDVVRRRASNNLYKAEFQQPSRRSRHVAVKKPKHAASSSRAPKSPAPPALCVETAARRNAAEQELIMRPEKNKLELEEEDEVADAHHCDSSLEEEVEEFPVSRRPSGRTHLSEAAAFVVPGKLWSSSLRAMRRYNENVSAKSNDFASAAPRGYLDTSPASLPDHLLPSLEASVPFQWEEAPGKPKTTTATAAEQKTCKVRSLSRQGIELNSFVEAVDVHFQTTAAEGAGPAPAALQDPQQSDSRRNVEEQEFGGTGPVAQLLSRRSSGDQAVRECSHRYYGKSSSGSTTGARSSSGCLQIPQEKETRIDLVAPAAAKFLVQEMSCYLSPLTTPPHDHHHAATFASSPVAVPFKWEETPGKPKLADDAASKLPHHHTLQLPPRLISTLQPRAAGLGSSFSARGGHQHSLVGGPLSGFFSPCRMNASSPHRAGHATVHSSSSFRGSKSLPKAGVFENSPLERKSNRSAFSAPLAATTTSASAAGLQPPSLYNSSPSTSELKAMMMMMSSSSPTSTLDHGPETESLSQTSASKSSFSGYLDACARPAATSTPAFTTTSSHAHSSKSSSSSRASYESVEQEFDHVELPTTTRSCSSLSYNSLQERGGCNGGHDFSFSSSSSLRNLGPGSTQQQDKDQSTHRGGGPRLGSSSTSEAVKALIIKLCRGGGNCFNTQPKSSSTTCSNTKPLQYLEVEAAPTLRTTCSSIQYCNMELNPNLSFVLDPSNRQLDEHASYHEYTTQKKIVVQDHQASKPLQASLSIPNTMHSCRLLPYDTMPLPSLEVEQEELATVTRDHLPHKPPKPNFTAIVCAAATVKQHTPGEIVSLQRCNASERLKSPSTKFQQGVHFIVSTVGKFPLIQSRTSSSSIDSFTQDAYCHRAGGEFALYLWWSAFSLYFSFCFGELQV